MTAAAASDATIVMRVRWVSRARRAAFDVARMVLHEDGEMVEPFEAEGAEQMGEPIGARFERAIADGLARARHDDGELIRARDRVVTWIHASPPWGFHISRYSPNARHTEAELSR